MIEQVMSIVLFGSFAVYFYCTLIQNDEGNKLILVLKSCLLAIPAFKINSIAFILEAHFIIISLIVRLVNALFKKQSPDPRLDNYNLILIPLVLSTLLVGCGYFNMQNIVKTEYHLTSNKLSKDVIRIVMLSDLHYPTTMKSQKLEKLVEEIKTLNPDYVILNGDIVDEYTSEESLQEVFNIFERLTRNSKVIYTIGNHDLGNYRIDNKLRFSDLKRLANNNNIEVLKDEVVNFDEVTFIVRDDYKNQNRKSIFELLKQVNHSNYLIMLDHQPKELEKAAQYGVDLHLSGHTHAGQIFPLYYFYELFDINEMNYGIKTYGQMQAINSSGVGGWGFPVRTDHHSEYVLITIES